MKSAKPGRNTSKVEVLNISRHGLWLLAVDREYFLPFKEFPWFKKADIGQIQDVKLLHGRHLFWKQLDIDLDLASLDNLEAYPLKYAG